MELMRKVQLVACAATAIQRIEFKKDVKIDQSGSIYIYWYRMRCCLDRGRIYVGLCCRTKQGSRTPG
jgi:hypothetical protein